MTEITRPFAPAPDKSTASGVEFAKNKKTKTYFFPRRVLVQLPSLERILFEMGPQEVAEEILVDARSMQWLVDNGVKPHVVAAPVTKLVKLPDITEHHVRFLQQRGYFSVKTIADAVRFVTNLNPREKAGFFMEAADWKGPQPNDSLDPNANAGAAPQERQTGDEPAAEDPNAGKGDEKENPKPADDEAANKPDDKAASARAGNTADDANSPKAATDAPVAAKSAAKSQAKGK